jgi:hypothetical protein
LYSKAAVARTIPPVFEVNCCRTTVMPGDDG